MKNVKVLLITLCTVIIVFGMVSNGSALLINLDTPTLTWGENTSNAVIKAAISTWVGDPDAYLYDASPDDGESGPLDPSYKTVFTASGQIETSVTSYVAGNIVGPTAYLIAKDGFANDDNPNTHAWYFYNLTTLGWNGTDTITITGLWPTQGSFSHISLYGTNTPEGGGNVPVPPTVWLLGSGLIGLIGLRRRFFRK